MGLYESWKEWKKRRARKLLEGEIEEATSELRIKLANSENKVGEYKLQTEQERSRTEQLNQELVEAGQAYKQQLSTIRNEQIRFSVNSRKSLEELTTAYRAATVEILLKRFPEKAEELGLEKGLLESYQQQEKTIAHLLTYASNLSNQILVSEAEHLEEQQPRLAKWPIAVIRGGDIIYSTGKFKKRLRTIPKQTILEQIEGDKRLYQLLCRGKETEVQINSQKGESYHLALIPHIQKGRELPEAIFVYLSPPEKHERMGRHLRGMVRDMKQKMYERLDRISANLPKLPKPEEYPST